MVFSVACLSGCFHYPGQPLLLQKQSYGNSLLLLFSVTQLWGHCCTTSKGTTLNQAPEVSALVFLTAGVLLGIAQRFFFLKILVPEVTLFHQCISIHFKKP